MKILVLNCSAFRGSITEGYCYLFSSACSLEKIKTTKINLYGEKIPMCNGRKYQRPDKLSDIQKLVIAADGLFISTSVHWFNVPAVLKNFIDHISCVDVDLWQKERPLCCFVYSPEGGEIGALSAIILPLNMMGFCLPANGYAYYNGKGDKWADDEVKAFPRRMKDCLEA